MTSNLSFFTLNLNFVHSYLNISVSLSCYRVVFEKSCQKGKEKLIKNSNKKKSFLIIFLCGGVEGFWLCWFSVFWL